MATSTHQGLPWRRGFQGNFAQVLVIFNEFLAIYSFGSQRTQQMLSLHVRSCRQESRAGYHGGSVIGELEKRKEDGHGSGGPVPGKSRGSLLYPQEVLGWKAP